MMRNSNKCVTSGDAVVGWPRLVVANELVQVCDLLGLLLWGPLSSCAGLNKLISLLFLLAILPLFSLPSLHFPHYLQTKKK